MALTTRMKRDTTERQADRQTDVKREGTQKGGKAKAKKGMKQHNLTKTVIGKTPPWTTKRLEGE